MYKLEGNSLHDTFFSGENKTRIMNMIKQLVQSKTGKQVGNQNGFDLYNLMWSVYSVNSYNYQGDVGAQVNTLNSIVVNKASDQVISGFLMYQQYIRDIYTDPVPNGLPVSTTQYGRKFGTNTRI